MTGADKSKKRVAVFVDGFNVYHSIDDMGKPHYMWLDLFALCQQFTDPKIHDIRNIWYFSAYAKHRPQSYALHQTYVAALEFSGVKCVMGDFKPKDKSCKFCKATWRGHEEKQSDVNFAVYLFREASLGAFDEAFLISRDSDLTPPVKLAREMYPALSFKILAPPERHHSKELVYAAHKKASIKEHHLIRAQFPEVIADTDGKMIARRPLKYGPPK